MEAAAKYILIALVLGIILILAVGEFAAFFWILRKIKRDRPPLTPDQYRFFAKFAAIILFALSAGFALYTTAFLITGAKTTALVVGMREKQGDNGEQMYSPIYRFTNASGITNTVEANIYSSPKQYETNQLVPVIYSRSNPTNCRMNSFEENWLASFIFGSFGMIILVSMPLYRKWRSLSGTNNFHASLTD